MTGQGKIIIQAMDHCVEYIYICVYIYIYIYIYNHICKSYMYRCRSLNEM